MKNVPTIPAVKIRMMKASLRCFILGLLGLLPIIGLPFALGALWVSGQARAHEKHLWNPARPYRILGVAAAAVSAVIWGMVDTLLIARAFSNYVQA
jgi:hypothetical protein